MMYFVKESFLCKLFWMGKLIICFCGFDINFFIFINWCIWDVFFLVFEKDIIWIGFKGLVILKLGFIFCCKYLFVVYYILMDWCNFFIVCIFL